MASVGAEIDFYNTLHFNWDDTEQGSTATGTAIRNGLPSVGRNLLTDPIYTYPRFISLRAEAVERGCATATAIPLFIDGKVLSALALTAVEAADAFDQEEMTLLSELAADLAYGIDNLRTRIKHREAQAVIARLAYYALTGLPNRALLLDRLEEAIQTARQQHHPMALLYFQSGIYEELNKVFGYRNGDHLLKERGLRVSRTIKEDDVLARVGEAGFTLLLRRADADYAIQIAERLMTALYAPMEISGVIRIDGRASIGIALFPGHGASPDALLHRAKAAMSDVRPAAGGYAIYIGGQEKINTRRLGLMADLRRAIVYNELFLHFQPKVDIASRCLCGAEALVRGQHPRLGLIPTIDFVKLAEYGD